MAEKYKNITIISVGGMTNIAIALRLNPKIKDYINRIVFMGMGIDKHDQSVP